jgi:hypothetical protein
MWTVLHVLIEPGGRRGRGVEEHAAVGPGRDPREVGPPGERWLRRYSAKCCKHRGHLAGPRNGGVQIPVYLAPLQPQKHGSDSKLTCGTALNTLTSGHVERRDCSPMRC